MVTCRYRPNNSIIDCNLNTLSPGFKMSVLVIEASNPGAKMSILTPGNPRVKHQNINHDSRITSSDIEKSAVAHSSFKLWCQDVSSDPLVQSPDMKFSFLGPEPLDPGIKKLIPAPEGPEPWRQKSRFRRLEAMSLATSGL